VKLSGKNWSGSGENYTTSFLCLTTFKSEENASPTFCLLQTKPPNRSHFSCADGATAQMSLLTGTNSNDQRSTGVVLITYFEVNFSKSSKYF